MGRLAILSREGRRDNRRQRVEAVFDKSEAEAALDLLELTDFAWHDCYGELYAPDDIIEDVLLCSEANLGQLIRQAEWL